MGYRVYSLVELLLLVFGDGVMDTWRGTGNRVHFLAEDDSAWPCVLAGMVLRGDIVEDLGYFACESCMGLVRWPYRRSALWGSGKRDGWLRSVWSGMRRLERIGFEDSLREALGLPMVDEGVVICC